MKKFNIDFVGNLKKYLIASGAVILIGIICMAVFGVEMDINFTGGSRFTYTYEGDVNLNKVKTVADKTLGKDTTVTTSESAVEAGSSKIVVSAADVVVADEKDGSKGEAVQDALEADLQKAFKKNNIEFAESNVIQPSIAQGFYAKSVIAVILAAILVVVYIGIRFRKIGGVSAALFAWVALIHDVIIAFIACVIFRLQIDTNFVAVVLTIFGYSINDSVVIYDRIRENRLRNRSMPLRDVANMSINATLGRTITTSVTTFVAVVVIAVVAEFFGLTTLRSFAIPMSVGIISGTYSSVCLCSPMWVRWSEFSYNRKLKKEEAKKLHKKG